MDTDVQIPPKAASLGPLVGSFCFLGQVSGLGLRFETRVKGSGFRVCYVIIWGHLGHQRFGVRLFEVVFAHAPWQAASFVAEPLIPDCPSCWARFQLARGAV